MKRQKRKVLLRKFITLKCNVLNKSKILNFKKKKWENFINSINKADNDIFFFYKNKHLDLEIQCLPWYEFNFKKAFKNNLSIKHRFNYFYGNLKENKLKKIVRTSKRKKIVYSLRFLLSFFERKLDVVLYRCHFAESVNSAKQLISHGGILVNKVKITNFFYTIKEGDVVEVSKKFSKQVSRNVNKSTLWPVPPEYFYVRYRLLKIILLEDPNFYQLRYHFPFDPKINEMFNYYK